VLLYIKEYTLDLSASVLRGTMVSVSTHNSVKPESSRQKLGCSVIEAQEPLPRNLPGSGMKQCYSTFNLKKSVEKSYDRRREVLRWPSRQEYSTYQISVLHLPFPAGNRNT
jgi:hypothetical protein